MNREEIKKAVADAVVALPGAKPKQPSNPSTWMTPEGGGSPDEEPHGPAGSRNPDHHKLVGKDPEQAVYHLDAAGGQSHRGRCKTEDCMKRAGTGHREGCSVPAFYVILN